MPIRYKAIAYGLEPNLIVFIGHIWLSASLTTFLKGGKKIEILFHPNKKDIHHPKKQSSLKRKMSFNSRNNNSQSAARKPHCAHCQNTGEPESVYTSHWPRSLPDRTGKSNVTCPKLLNTECAYCYKFGHTRKFCPALKANEKAREHADRVNKFQPKPQQKVISRGGFAALAHESDEEDKPQKVVKEEWPALGGVPSGVTVTSGYAAMAAKPARVYEQEPDTPVSSYQVLSKTTEEEQWPTLSVKSVATKKIYPKGSWMADSDSEDGDEEDEVKAPALKPFVRDAW